jgi:hypothetical protein
MYALRPLRPELGSLNHVARGHQIRSRTIGKSILPIVEIAGTAEIVDIAGTGSGSPLSRRRGDLSDALRMQRSGARSITPMGMIWKSVRLFWITKRCHHQLQWCKSLIEASIVEQIPSMKIRWMRST